MDKEEILAKSREENKGTDEFEKQAVRDGGSVGAIMAVLLATVFFAIQVLLGENLNYGLYAVVFVVPATTFIVKARRLKRKHEMFLAVLFTITTIVFSVMHIWQLVGASTIL